MTWTETGSETFVARHDARDGDDARQVLLSLEAARGRLERLFVDRVGELAVVLHGNAAQLDAAMPLLPVRRRLTAPAARRYVVGWAADTELHVLAPRVLAQRASNVEGSLEALMLSPVVLLAKRVAAANNPRLPPPFGPRAFARYLRWAWLVEGAAGWASGQVRHIRPAVSRRMREGGAPAFPPTVRDAPLLGSTVFDLLAREEGDRACVDLVRADLARTPRELLEATFQGRALHRTEGTWRAHLARLAGGELRSRPTRRRPEAR